MAVSFTISSQRFPAGATVEAYLLSNWGTHQLPPSGAPQGSAAASDTVGSDGTADFTGLTPETRYVAYANVDDEHRYVAFTSVEEVEVPAAELIGEARDPDGETVTITGGEGLTDDGGSVWIFGGEGVDDGGSVRILGGNGADGGDVEISGGEGTASNGEVVISGASGGDTGADVTLSGGNGAVTNGNVLVEAGRGVGTPGNVRIASVDDELGFYGGSTTQKPTVTGSRGGNAALASLLTSLAALGLITDDTTA